MPFEAGARVGQYTVVGKLGAGGVGVVAIGSEPPRRLRATRADETNLSFAPDGR